MMTGPANNQDKEWSFSAAIEFLKKSSTRLLKKTETLKTYVEKFQRSAENPQPSTRSEPVKAEVLKGYDSSRISSEIETAELLVNPMFVNPLDVLEEEDQADPLTKPGCYLVGRRSNEETRHLEQSYVVKGQAIGTETITRVDTVNEIIEYGEAKLAYLNEELTNPHSEEERRSIQRMIAFTEKNLANAYERLNNEETRPTWLDANAYRTFLSDQDIDTFKDKTESMISGVVNLRVQAYKELPQVKEGQEPKAAQDESPGNVFLRGSIASDNRNGWTNLRELRAIKKDLKAGNVDSFEAKKSAIQQRMESLETQAQKDSGEYAIEQLSNIEAAIETRQLFLNDYMLQLVMTQLSENPLAIDQDGVVNLTHLSLLNPSKDMIDKKGWAHIERNQILDMKELFKDFENKKIIYDGEDSQFRAPYIDLDGNIHINQPPPDRAIDGALTLNPIFINVTVQRKVKDPAFSKEVNKDGIAKLRALRFGLIDEEMEKVLKRLEAGEASYFAGEDFAVAAQKCKVPLSMSCASGKDRTGFVAARTCQRNLEQSIEKNESLTPQEKEAAIKKFAGEILDTDGLAAQVVKDNTNVTVLKVSSFRLPGINPLKRTIYGLKQLIIPLFTSTGKSSKKDTTPTLQMEIQPKPDETNT